MTGEKDKAVPAIKMWNLDDNQLKTPEHDKLIFDLLDQNNLKKIFPNFFTIRNDQKISIESESIITNGENRYIIGYWDIIIKKSCEYNDGYGIADHVDNAICVEVKPRIDSFGAVLRQINTYKKFTFIPCRDPCRDLRRGGIVKPSIFLYTPDTRFDTAFASQEITVIHPQP